MNSIRDPLENTTETSEFDAEAYRRAISHASKSELISMLVREAELRAKWEHRALHRERDIEEDAKFVRRLMAEKQQMTSVANQLCAVIQTFTDLGER